MNRFFVMMMLILGVLTPVLGQSEDDLAVITPENVDQLVEVMRFGYGYAIDFVYSRDNKWLAVGSSMGLWIHDVENPQNLPRRMDEVTNYVTRVAFTADNRYVIGGGIAGNKAFLNVWDVLTGELFQRLDGHANPVFGIDVSPDGSHMVTISNDETALVWSMDTWETVFTLSHSNAIGTALYHPDGAQIASVTADGYLYIWSPQTGEQLNRIRVRGIRDIAYNSDGTRLIVTTLDGIATLWDTSLYEPIEELFDIPEDLTMFVRYRPDDEQALFVLDESRVLLYDFATKTSSQINIGGNRSQEVIYSPDGSTFLTSVSFSGVIRIWDSNTHTFIKTWENTYSINGFTYSPDGESVVITRSDGVLQRFDIGSWDVQQEMFDKTNFSVVGDELVLFDLQYSGDGQYLLATRYYTGVVNIYDAQTWEYVNQIIWGSPMLVRPTTAEIFLFGINQRWNVETDESLGEVDIMKQAIFGDYDPTGSMIAFATNEDIINNPIFILDNETQSIVQQLDGHSGFVRSLKYSPDGTMIASGSANGVIRVWDIETGDIIQTLRGHNDRVDDIVYSPDSSLIASASDDNTVRLWDIEQGDLIKTILVQSTAGFHPLVGFTPNGKYLLLNDTRTLYIWGIPQEGE